jgi:NAD(P)-dependent dehydrogenase (short-subunit alcohol dehydrogenase family)
MFFPRTIVFFHALYADVVDFVSDGLVQSVITSFVIVSLLFGAYCRSSHKDISERKRLLVVITGCDSGFGLATAKRLSCLGYRVVATCMTQEGLERLQTFTTAATFCDVTKDEDVKALAVLVDRVMEESANKKPIAEVLTFWALINNAGIAPMGCVDWMPLEAFKLAIEVNYYGPIRMIHQFMPLLKLTRGSRIINLSSVAGLCGAPFLGPYGGSKHALEGMGKALREEMKPFGVEVVHINPGVMK